MENKEQYLKTSTVLYLFHKNLYDYINKKYLMKSVCGIQLSFNLRARNTLWVVKSVFDERIKKQYEKDKYIKLK